MKKLPIALRVEPDVAGFYARSGLGQSMYQTMNKALEDYAALHEATLEELHQKYNSQELAELHRVLVDEPLSPHSKAALSRRSPICKKLSVAQVYFLQVIAHTYAQPGTFAGYINY